MICLYSPLNQVRASDVDGASKYKIALLSTKRSARRGSVSYGDDVELRKLLTIAMNNASRLWEGLHPKDSP